MKKMILTSLAIFCLSPFAVFAEESAPKTCDKISSDASSKLVSDCSKFKTQAEISKCQAEQKKSKDAKSVF